MSDDQFPDYLNVYYKKLFPYSQFHKWLSYGNRKFFFNHPINIVCIVKKLIHSYFLNTRLWTIGRYGSSSVFNHQYICSYWSSKFKMYCLEPITKHNV